MKTVPAGPGKRVIAGPGRGVIAGGGRGHWRTYDVTDGLLNGMVFSMVQDREGHLWFGTGGGVMRYDGRAFTTFNAHDGLANNSVFSILQDREGHLWFGTGGGLSRYDGHTFTTFTAQDGLSQNHVMSMIQDREGRLWFGTGEGVSRYDGQTFSTLTTRDGLAGDSVVSILQDREGVLWFGTEGGLSRYDGRSFTPFTTENGLTNNVVRSILQDREGYLWFGTGGGGVSRYDGQSFITFTTKDGLTDNRVFSIFQDREGYLWFGTGGGLSRYDGASFIHFTTKQGLLDNAVYSIFQDREGVLWFGTEGGLSRYDGQSFINFTTEDGLRGNSVRSILQDREGWLWVSTNNGVSHYDSRFFTDFALQDGLPATSVRSILQDREGYLWFGIEGWGVCRCDPLSPQESGWKVTAFTPKDGLGSNNVSSIFQDREGRLWFGTSNGLSRYNPLRLADARSELALPVLSTVEGSETKGQAPAGSEKTGKPFTTFTPKDGLAGHTVTSILQDREGNLWIGTNSGLSRYDPSTPGFALTTPPVAPMRSQPLPGSGQGREGRNRLNDSQDRSPPPNPGEPSGMGTFTRLTAKDGLAHDFVTSILQDQKGLLWLGTQGGVNCYDGRRFTPIEIGPAKIRMRSMFQDRQGRLYFGTNGGGVIHYDGTTFQTLTQRDGLAGNIVDVIFQDREGVLWFGANGGLTRYCPPEPAPIPVFIDAVLADRRYEGVAELEIPASVGLAAFEFRGVSFKTRPEAMVYRYRLKGYDADWKTTQERRVEYQDLSPGEYAFQVQAVDRDLNYSDPATVRLTVVPDLRVDALTEALSRSGSSGEFVGTSQALRRVQTQLLEVARTDETVLILGETGTGKGLAARAVHALSGRRSDPFIQVNCGAIPEGLVESELFGHERGAFTGAVSRKLGKVELAEGGTLFLDEIGDLAIEAQVKLLRALEEQTFERVGGTQTLRADARVIAATNRDLKQMVLEGKFREDLYFRLQAFPIRMPPLRERREDILLLAAYFTERMAAHLNKQVTHLTPEALALLRTYDWPGNVRELEHAVRRAVIVSRGQTIQARDILLEFGSEGPEEEAVTLEEHERRYIREVLKKTGGVIKGPHGAAVMLGLPESTLRSRMKRLGLLRTGV